ncbi:hypothetical protein, partial [Rhodopirellula europaea]|uniref:hypothetical protein n=1 Tax=Rhodopirellula europaea TaxID=1263866 RepID=UPI001F27EC71
PTEAFAALTNPYAPSQTNVRDLRDGDRVRPDWKWMTGATYALCCFCMLGIVGKTNPPTSNVVGFGHGFIRLPAVVGDTVFYCMIPVLAILPTALISVPLLRLYRSRNPKTSMTASNFGFLLVGLLIAVVNASCYRGD